ncbi:unnamed protein product [Urochloa humidicola]
MTCLIPMGTNAVSTIATGNSRRGRVATRPHCHTHMRPAPGWGGHIALAPPALPSQPRLTSGASLFIEQQHHRSPFLRPHRAPPDHAAPPSPPRRPPRRRSPADPLRFRLTRGLLESPPTASAASRWIPSAKAP